MLPIAIYNTIWILLVAYVIPAEPDARDVRAGASQLPL